MKPQKGDRRKLKAKTFIREKFSDQEWKSFKSNEEELSAAKSEEMRSFILGHIAEKQERKQTLKIKIVQFTKYLSAACVIVLLGIALFIGLNTKHVQPEQVYVNRKVNTQLIGNAWKIVSNSGRTIIAYKMPDSSLISIYPHSTIKFEKLFNQKFRDVYLKGKAKFKVKRNTERPFSVYSGALKTTALGTSFTISTIGHNISVKLHTGKIVVANTRTKKPLAYISDVGTTLLYNPSEALTRLIKAPATVAPPTEILKRTGNFITMKNIPLSRVFNLLNEAYGIKISANQKEIGKITFTGSVDTEKEEPEAILKTICLINNMTLNKVSQQEFIIQKSN
ncbi:FecR family protein [Pedobacter sp. HDW13]|uniref:FecR family protein n=1 Tax=Pedobacter sp. HDW13 TaxID=2714940 RepID=UPI00140DEFDB|nr:FecR family protein [Pedobacter sp. HDW13]QIL41327.1 FecR family protein [Pedobacter sp. HDW13]